jgi:hypothetical protein
MRHVLVVALGAVAAWGVGGNPSASDAPPVHLEHDRLPPWLTDVRVLVRGVGVSGVECRTDVCAHNENTDVTRFGGAIYVVHRTAQSQVLGPNSSLRVLRSDDDGASFSSVAVISAPRDRDIRDPHFYEIGGKLAIKALTRLPFTSARDSDVATVAVATTSDDGGRSWSAPRPIGPPTWSFWRIKSRGGVDYSAAYEDGDKSVKLFSSRDGAAWTPGAVIYDVAADTPLETELVFMPSGRLLALVRMDGSDRELLGGFGRLRTKVCWAEPPYASFSCPQELDGARLDGPLAFFHGSRLFVVARKHLPALNRKRTALYELGGQLDGGALTLKELAELPSAGDTSYAGIAEVDADRSLVTWYSGELASDHPWFLGMLEASDIWSATIDWRKI